MTSQNEKIVDIRQSAAFMIRLASTLKSTQKESITPDELIQMAKILISRANAGHV